MKLNEYFDANGTVIGIRVFSLRFDFCEREREKEIIDKNFDDVVVFFKDFRCLLRLTFGRKLKGFIQCPGNCPTHRFALTEFRGDVSKFSE